MTAACATGVVDDDEEEAKTREGNDDEEKKKKEEKKDGAPFRPANVSLCSIHVVERQELVSLERRGSELSDLGGWKPPDKEQAIRNGKRSESARPKRSFYLKISISFLSPTALRPAPRTLGS